MKTKYVGFKQKKYFHDIKYTFMFIYELVYSAYLKPVFITKYLIKYFEY